MMICINDDFQQMLPKNLEDPQCQGPKLSGVNNPGSKTPLPSFTP